MMYGGMHPMAYGGIINPMMMGKQPMMGTNPMMGMQPMIGLKPMVTNQAVGRT
jgi:hypothetical protein